MKKLNAKINSIVKRIDGWHLGWLGIIVVAFIMTPILYLGEGSVFPIHDQLDETILNYVFSARYMGQDTYEAMMCGAAATSGLKPFAPVFVLLYLWLKPFTAFVIQYFAVIATAWFGAYACVKFLTKSSISALLAASVFALLPFRSVYGNLLSGIPLLLACLLLLHKEDKFRGRTVLYYAGIAFYTVTTSLVLIGYAVLSLMGIVFLTELIIKRKFDKRIFISALIMAFLYILMNFDIVKQVFGAGGLESHREEFSITGNSLWGLFKMYLSEGVVLNESFHKYIYIAIIVALPISIFNLIKKNKLGKIYFALSGLILFIAFLAAFFGSTIFAKWQGSQTGMIRSFQAGRFYLILPGLWYVLLGVTIAEILSFEYKEKSVALMNLCVAAAVYLPTLNYVARNPDCIFYQNVNQINNSDITGYVTWEKLYAEDLMSEIESDIGLDMTTYRVGSIGMTPAVSLMHGFYTIDGYSNNYSLEYKHKFAEIIDNELQLNNYIAAYFLEWGNRCYLFTHEWANAYLVGKNQNAKLTNLRLNIDKMKDLNCKYIFSAGEIENAEELGITLFGIYESEESYWRIWVYEL